MSFIKNNLDPEVLLLLLLLLTEVVVVVVSTTYYYLRKFFSLDPDFRPRKFVRDSSRALAPGALGAGGQGALSHADRAAHEHP